MADAIPHTSKPESQVPEGPYSVHVNSSKSLSHFFYKAALITVFLLLLPLFPAQAPEFVNQTLHGRSWELVQLVFVGISVSYGLFSKKNDDMSEKDHNSKLGGAQSYVSTFLQVSSVFDNESEGQTTVIDEDNSNSSNNNKVQTWNSQYYRGEPVVVVAKESPGAAVRDIDQTGTVVSGISQKPLLLPVRSLRQRVPEQNDLINDKFSPDGKLDCSINRSGWKRFSRNNSSEERNGEFGGSMSCQKLEENVVLRSPIPWRSRSGRLIHEMKETAADGLESNRSFRLNSSPKSLPFNSSETEAKNNESGMRKKNFGSNIPAPPPPPPPPPFLVRKSNSSRQSVAAEDLNEIISGVLEERMDSVSELKKGSRIKNDAGLHLGKSVRTFRSFCGTEFDHNIKSSTVVERKGDTEEEDSEAEDEINNDKQQFEGSSRNIINNGEAQVGPDVDKKADEFIAKFREQIRLQRIESIRRSTSHRSAAGKTLK